MDEIKILTNDTKVGRNDEGNVTDVLVKTNALFRGDNIEGVGMSYTHPEDIDLSTEGVGARLAFLRSMVDIHDRISEYPMSKEDADELTKSKKDLEKSIEKLINDKEYLFQKIRINRDPVKKAENSIRTVHISEDGKVEELNG